MSNKKILTIVIVSVILLVFVIFRYGHYRRGTPLTFVEVIPDQKASGLDGVRYTGATPIIVVVTPQDRSKIAQYVPTEPEHSTLETADFEGLVLIGVFQGIKSNTIAGAKVTDVYQSGSDVYVHTFFTVPKGQLAGQLAGTSAYSIVGIYQSDLNMSDTPLTFHLIDQETQTKLAAVVFTP